MLRLVLILWRCVLIVHFGAAVVFMLSAFLTDRAILPFAIVLSVTFVINYLGYYLMTARWRYLRDVQRSMYWQDVDADAADRRHRRR